MSTKKFRIMQKNAQEKNREGIDSLLPPCYAFAGPGGFRREAMKERE
jgi:hypothetical protein